MLSSDIHVVCISFFSSSTNSLAASIPLMHLTSAPVFIYLSLCHFCMLLILPQLAFNSTKYIFPPGKMINLSGTPGLAGLTNLSAIPPICFTWLTSHSSILLSSGPLLTSHQPPCYFW